MKVKQQEYSIAHPLLAHGCSKVWQQDQQEDQSPHKDKILKGLLIY